MHEISEIYICFCLLKNIPQFTKNKRKKKKKGKGEKRREGERLWRGEGKEKDGGRRWEEERDGGHLCINDKGRLGENSGKINLTQHSVMLG